MDPGPRYLLPFVPDRLPTLRWPVVVIGGGLAGGAAALEAARSGVDVLQLQKAPTDGSNTAWAQGGIAASIGPEDSSEIHAEDTLAVGCGLSEPEAVRAIVAEGPEAVRWLEALGVDFDRRDEGGMRAGLEGGHSRPRVLSSGGASTGLAIQTAVDRGLDLEARITRRSDLMAVDLLCHGGRCIGLLALERDGSLLQVLASHVVLATGASGQIYRETTNPSVATGDGVAMAWRAGAELQDLEFFQFHPTTLYIAGAARVLISEAVRGAGARLVDRLGRRVMEGVHPDLDLAPRDVVSRAILARMVETGDTHVYLDASGIDAERRFPSIAAMCRAFGLELDRDPIPVRPGAHYQIGGVLTDMDGRTTLDGLLATGEVASTGLHGGNRLASNSLLEALVLGRRAGRLAAGGAPLPGFSKLARLDDRPGVAVSRPASEPRLNLDDMLYSLKSMMWRQAGLVREAFPLADAVEKITFWERVLISRPEASSKWVELANMLCVSRLLARSALQREESRGTHHRADFPDRDDRSWRRHSRARRSPAEVVPA
ncbi:MAG: L-aspartate oxidase [Planctomycetota bacterium]